MFAIFLSMCLSVNSDTTRYLTIPPKIQHKDAQKLVDFTLNSISRHRRMTKSKLVGNKLFFDLQDYGIDANIYDEFVKKSPYQDVRVDWFVNYALQAPYYYKLLGVKDLKSFRKLVGFTDKMGQRAVILQSEIARNNRRMQRFPTIFGGYYWESHDVFRSISDKDYIDALLNDANGDSLEVIGTLPNGLLVYFVSNKKGQALDSVDSSVSIDIHSSDKVVRTAISCIICHTKGIHMFTDEVRTMLKNDVSVTVVKKSDFNRVADLFGGELPIQRDQLFYKEAVEWVAAPEVISKLVFKARELYTKPLTKQEAAAELGVSVKDFDVALRNSLNPYLISLFLNRPIRRDRWESLFSEASTIVAK